MNDKQAFLNAIIESPEDNGLRLIYADFLDENGEPEQAELIRVQIELFEIEGNQLELFTSQIKWDECTCLSANWCPNCGDCCCPSPEEEMNDQNCQLHSDSSKHCAWQANEERTKKLEGRESVLAKSIRIRNTDSFIFIYDRGLPDKAKCSAQDWETNATAILKECPIREVELVTLPEVTTHRRLFNWKTMTQPMPDWYAIQVERHPVGTTGEFVAPTTAECYDAWEAQWPRIKFTRPPEVTTYGYTNGTVGWQDNFSFDDLLETMRSLQATINDQGNRIATITV